MTKLDSRLAQIRAHANANVQTRSTFLNDITILLRVVEEYERALIEISTHKWRIETMGTHTGPTAEAHIAIAALAEAERLAGGGE